jgi:hypothetical protein
MASPPTFRPNRDARLSRAQTDRPPAPAPGALGRERGRGRAARGPAGAFRTISWRTGTKGPLRAEFAAIRVRVADGPVAAGGRHLPGEEAWLVGEHRATGERKYYLSNLPPDATLEALAALIKARWVCEQMHQQLKGELGTGPLRGPELARAPSPRPAVPARLRLPAAPAARGGKASAPHPSPGRRQGRACPPSGGASWRPSPAPSCAAPHCRRRFEHHLRL